MVKLSIHVVNSGLKIPAITLGRMYVRNGSVNTPPLPFVRDLCQIDYKLECLLSLSNLGVISIVTRIATSANIPRFGSSVPKRGLFPYWNGVEQVPERRSKRSVCQEDKHSSRAKVW